MYVLKIKITVSCSTSNVPQMPTVAESGVPGYEAGSWYGIIAPAGTLRAVVARLTKEITGVLGAPDFREQIMAAGADPMPNTPDEFAAYIKSEIAKWAKVIKLSGAKADAQ